MDRWRVRVTSRASALAWLGLLASACGAEPVEARAIWVDDFGGAGQRRIHVYDRGELDEFEVLGRGGPIERAQLDPHGRGVLVRTGDFSGAWIDLDDGRRLPLSLPSSGIAGVESPVEIGDRALTWIDELEDALVVVPLAPGLALTRGDDGRVEPLRRGSAPAWRVMAAHAPIVFAAGKQNGEASFFRYPTRSEQPLAIALEAEAEGLSLPATPIASRTCLSALDCFSMISLAPEGELAMFSAGKQGPWSVFDRRSPATAGPLALPERLAHAQADGDLRLLAVLDRAVSIWIGAGQLYRLDRTRAQVDSLPIFLDPPIHWTAAEQGRALILSSGSGPVYRADLDGLRAISLETTQCANPREPVVSPNGRWLAWTCTDLGQDFTAQSGAVVRVSTFGLERYAGVPMTTLAIDDDGDVLLYSFISSYDGLEVVGSSSVPQTLFVLSGDGTLTRIDELEPGPAPVFDGGALATYIQGVALPRSAP